MVRPWPGTRPSSSLPALHALQLGGLVDLNHTVDLTVRMRMVLAPEHLLRFHINCRDADKVRVGGRRGDS